MPPNKPISPFHRPSRDYSFKDEVYEKLDKAGFIVILKDMGKAPFHKTKYDLIYEIMDGKNPKLPRFRINTTNNEVLISAIKQTGVILGGRNDGFEKDKRPEKDKTFPQENAPHGPDALDMLLWGKYGSRLAHHIPTGGFDSE